MFDWPLEGLLSIPEVAEVNAAWVLSDKNKTPLEIKNTGAGISLQLPNNAPDTICSVIAIEMN